MNEKQYKKLYGNIFYELECKGFSIQLLRFVNNNQLFTIDKSYLKNFYFVLSVKYESEEDNYAVCTIYLIPKYKAIDETANLDLEHTMRYSFVLNNYTVNTTNTIRLIAFIKQVKKDIKYYFYHSVIREYSSNKKPSRRFLNKFFKTNKSR